MAVRATGRDARMVEGLPAPVGVASEASRGRIGIGGDALVQLIGQPLIVGVAGRAIELAERGAVAVADIARDRVRTGGYREAIMCGWSGPTVGSSGRPFPTRDGEERETQSNTARKGQRDPAPDHRVAHELPLPARDEREVDVAVTLPE